jgi:CheY-like chemotaxis protein
MFSFAQLFFLKLKGATVNIGVLDDNPGILQLLETTLKLDGHTVFAYTTSTSMLDVLANNQSQHLAPPYDLAIIDILLPGAQNGVDVFSTIRKNYPAWQLPVIIITAVSGPTLDQFRQILPDDVPILRKPFTPRSLRQLVNSAFQNT